MRKKVIVGNWKMFKNKSEAVDYASEFKKIFDQNKHEVGICCSFTHLAALKEQFEGTGIKIGAQNMHYADEGAFTGEISPGMLAELDVDYCIIGHSERRQYFNETDETVNLKLKAAKNNKITPILCVGETLKHRETGREFEIVQRQLAKDIRELKKETVSNMIIAYEPVWAIGTGRTADSKQAEEMCGFVRSVIEKKYDIDTAEKTRIQYGGSVNPANASELLSQNNIDGALVGGASLKPKDFMEIIRSV